MNIFDTRDIRAFQEIYVHYGDRYWEVKKGHEVEEGSYDLSTTSSSNNA
jgi:SET domain-containing protein